MQNKTNTKKSETWANGTHIKTAITVHLRDVVEVSEKGNNSPCLGCGLDDKGLTEVPPGRSRHLGFWHY